jgi:hypothetical protein
MNPSEPPELLGPRLTKGEARPLENQAKRHYRAAGKTSHASPPTSDACKTAK